MAGELAKALAQFQAKLPHIGLNAKAPVPGGRIHKYADLASVCKTVLPALGEAGLSFTARPTVNGEGHLVLAYSLLHESGEREDGEYPLTGGTAHQIGSAITYARRYCLCAVTGVAADEDDDGAAAHDAPAAEQEPARNGRTRAKVTGPEHERLRHGTVEPTPEDRPAGRGQIPPAEDRWTDQQPGPFDASLVEPEDRPGGSDSGQLKKIHAKLGALGLTDRDKGLTVIEQIIGHPLAGPHRAPDESDRTSKNLSWQDAEKVLKELTNRLPVGQAAGG